ncbi:MAG: hypothetical protein RBS39_04135 [Phycisphaerales bacterium]|jgi:ElaB/YqjD/DUF883 family membrane-anchored ribosome-binding protein|nr:hypothetical protein [Phycisphaerales bacterium]
MNANATIESRTNPSSASRTTIRDDIDAVKSDVNSLVSDTTDLVKHSAEKSSEAVKSGIHATSDSVKSLAQQASQVHGEACEYVKRNPTASVLVAIGVGALIGRLFAR